MKECIVLAGGFGTRLQSVVSDVPKCLASINGVPFLQYLFDYLERENFSLVVLSLGYKAEKVLAWIKTQKRSFKIDFILEDIPLGTGGAIKYALSKTHSKNIFVFNGDTYFDIPTDTLINFHNQKKASISLGLKEMNVVDRYGTVLTNFSGRVIEFLEKKSLPKGIINGGVYLVDKHVFESYGTEKQSFSFEKDILEKFLNELDIFGMVFSNYFIDIGIPSDLKKMNVDFAHE